MLERPLCITVHCTVQSIIKMGPPLTSEHKVFTWCTNMYQTWPNNFHLFVFSLHILKVSCVLNKVLRRVPKTGLLGTASARPCPRWQEGASSSQAITLLSASLLAWPVDCPCPCLDQGPSNRGRRGGGCRSTGGQKEGGGVKSMGNKYSKRSPWSIIIKRCCNGEIIS